MHKGNAGANQYKDQSKLSIFVKERHEDLVAMAGATLAISLVLSVF